MLSSEEKSMALEDFYSMIGIDHGFKVLFLHGVTNNSGCNCMRSTCKSIGKHPVEKWKGSDFLREKAVKREEVSYYTGLVQKNMFNFGVVCGKNHDQNKSLIVVDFDDVELGKDLISKLKLENTCEVISGKGIHFYFLGNMESRIKIKNQGFDIICNNRFVVGPGSKHSSGKQYEWNGKDLKQLPDWFYNQFKTISTKEQTNDEVAECQNFNGKQPIKIGERNQTLFNELIKTAKRTNFNRKEIVSTANKCWSMMEGKESFTKQEVERTIKSVLSYKDKSKPSDDVKERVQFSLENASNMWVKRLVNLGIIDSHEVVSMNLFNVFLNFENRVFQLSIKKKSLTDQFTGHTVSEYTENRNQIMDKVFNGIPLWNYLNIEHQNWASIFNREEFHKRRYRGVKYFGKGNCTKEKVGFGYEFVSQESVIKILNAEFRTLVELISSNIKTLRGKIIKFTPSLDSKIAEYLGVDKSHFDSLAKASKDNPQIWPINRSISPTITNTLPAALTTHQISTSLCLESRVSTMTTENQEPKAKVEKKLLSETKVKVTDNPKHVTKYRSVRTMEYNEAEMLYVSNHDEDMIAAQTDGILSNRQLVLDTISSWKRDDIIGIGCEIYVFDAAYEEDDEIVLYKKFYVKDCKPEGLVKRDANKVVMTFAALNKEIDMGYVDVLYRDEEVYGLSDKEKYRTYRVYEMQKSEEQSSTSDAEQTSAT